MSVVTEPAPEQKEINAPDEVWMQEALLQPAGPPAVRSVQWSFIGKNRAD